MKATGVIESCLYAEDLTAAEMFYGEVMGLELISREEGRHVFFRCGNSVVLIFNPEHTSRQQTEVEGTPIPLHGARGAGHLAFRLPEDDFSDWQRHLMQCGVGIESEVMWPNGGKSIYFRDPAETASSWCRRISGVLNSSMCRRWNQSWRCDERWRLLTNDQIVALLP